MGTESACQRPTQGSERTHSDPTLHQERRSRGPSVSGAQPGRAELPRGSGRRPASTPLLLSPPGTPTGQAWLPCKMLRGGVPAEAARPLTGSDGQGGPLAEGKGWLSAGPHHPVPP